MTDLLAPERRRDRLAADRTPPEAPLTIRELVSYRLHVVANLLSRGAAMRYKREFGVSLWEWRTVALLGAQAPLSLNELARAAGLDKSQMSRVVSGLAGRGLVLRGEDEADGRGVKLSLTRAGERLYEDLIRAAAERNAAFLGCARARVPGGCAEEARRPGARAHPARARAGGQACKSESAVGRPPGRVTEETCPVPLYMDKPARSDRQLPLTDAERAARVQLAACYRVFDHLGWTELIFNHITLRIPGPEPIFLINPFGLHYREVTASSLVAIDLEGNPVRPTEFPVNRAGFVTHSAIHGAIADAHCVMHTHTTTGVAVASLAGGLAHDTFYGAQLHGRVAYHEFEGVTVNEGERARLVASIGRDQAVILRNHGLLTWGRTLPEAFMWLWTLQRACDVQIAAAAAGALRPLGPEVFAQAVRESAPGEPAVCEAVFAALVRAIEAKDPRYRD
jgi:ribulose-5-phosphate 4-epimerase/fuculose-1-phosphate aldolase/DNA-binding MarR family transcriptional regulator